MCNLYVMFYTSDEDFNYRVCVDQEDKKLSHLIPYNPDDHEFEGGQGGKIIGDILD